ncbi:MAG: tetratricopeptide repeat protein [Bacteroidales bacterium]|nr:tetratricopeptide repeat protein [Bacteroidales bacterium]
MKKVTVNYLALMIATAFVAGGCNGLKKMADNANLIQRSIEPNPLEMHAGKVPVSITVTFPAKYFDKNAYLICTPSLSSTTETKEVKLKSATLQGEKVKDNNTTISYKNGGSYTYKDTVDYVDAFKKSDLLLSFEATKDGESELVTAFKIGDGVIVTPLLVEEGLKVDNGTVGDNGAGRTIDAKVAKPTSSETTKDLTVFYPMQKSDMTSSEKKKNDVKSFVQAVTDVANDDKTELKSIQVASYASPDGPEDINSKLVDGRGKTSVNFVKDQLKKVQGTQADNFIQRQTTAAEDWDGFKKATEESELKDKALILRVLSMYSDPVVREREIKNISEAYTDLKGDILPKLRRSEIKAICQSAEKTEDEIAKLAKENPAELTQDEALYASTSKLADLDAKQNVLENYVSRFPEDWRGYNNLGNVYLKQNKLDKAEQNLNKANELNSNEAAVYNNLGVVALAKGDTEKAKEYFTKAKNIGGNEEAGYNLGVLNIKDGEYAQAVSNFGSTPSFNKSLAQLLNKSNKDANSTINSVDSEEAAVSYLKAVIAARDGKVDDVVSNLKDACKKDSYWKDYAKTDVEFLKFIENEAFKSVID